MTDKTTTEAFSFLSHLREVSAARCNEWAYGEPVDILFHAVELGEEAGEVLGAVKKLYRSGNQWRGTESSLENLRDEIGDVMICLDKVANAYDIDIASATIEKFNKTSIKHGFIHRLVWPSENNLRAENERLREALAAIVFEDSNKPEFDRIKDRVRANVLLTIGGWS